MVAEEDIDTDLGAIEPPHLLREKDTGVEVAPVSVVEIPGNNYKINLIFNCTVHKIDKGDPRGSTKGLCRRSLICRKPD